MRSDWATSTWPCVQKDRWNRTPAVCVRVRRRRVDTTSLSFWGWPAMSIHTGKWKPILSESPPQPTHTHIWRGLRVHCCALCLLTFRVIWKVPPHLAAGTNPRCRYGNAASRDKTSGAMLKWNHFYTSTYRWQRTRLGLQSTGTTHTLCNTSRTHLSTSVLHLSLISFTHLSTKSSPLGLYSFVRRVRTTTFSVLEALLACCDKGQSAT